MNTDSEVISDILDRRGPAMMLKIITERYPHIARVFARHRVAEPDAERPWRRYNEQDETWETVAHVHLSMPVSLAFDDVDEIDSKVTRDIAALENFMAHPALKNRQDLELYVDRIVYEAPVVNTGGDATPVAETQPGV